MIKNILITISVLIIILNFLKKQKRNNILVVRILGNDMNDMHGENQTYNNLKYTLENEHDFKNCDKLWILNRIIDKIKYQKYENILKKYNKKYITIKFEKKKFEKLKKKYPVNFDEIKNEFDLMSKLYVFIKYVCNINTARNIAIEYGKKQNYIYTFPLDGSCFFTNEQFKEINNYIVNNRNKLTLVLPLIRLSHYKIVDYLDKNIDFTSNWSYEPQIGFHYKNDLKFDENLAYAMGDKCTLLKILNVKGPWSSEDFKSIYDIKEWHSILIKPFNLLEKLYIKYKNKYKYIPKAAVFRLPYNNNKKEVETINGLEGGEHMKDPWSRYTSIYLMFKELLTNDLN